MGNLQSNLPVPPNPVATPADQYWPILAKGQASRLVFPGPPTLEKNWHTAMEQGRLLEGSINDAMLMIQKEKLDIERHIQQYLDLNQVAADAQFKRHARRFKLAFDILNFIEKIHKYMSDVQGLTQAIQTNLQILQTIEAQAQSMLENNLNALANFMLQICNLGMPPLPAIPTFFGTNIFSFNGFDLQNLVPRGLNFSQFSNFSFAQCTLAPPNTGIYDQPPVVFNFEGYTVGGSSGSIVLPQNGRFLNPASTTADQMQADTLTPVYDATTTNSANVLQGSLPNPVQIISNYQLPSSTYVQNVISAVPSLATLVTAQAPTVAAQSEERKLFTEYVTLGAVVDSNYDQNLLAAWLLYLQATRNGRGGQWLPSFEATYQTYVQPSLDYLQSPTTLIPWNTALGGTGTTAAPAAIPLVSAIQNSPSRQNILWKLSYLEASLLGYNRNPSWDSGADSVFLSSFTGTDLDYVTTSFDPTDTVTITLGADTASYPVDCVVPKAMANTLAEVILVAAANIAGNPNYVTTKPQFRFTYNAYAQATQVDRFTQFWRTFNYEVQQFLAQDPYVVGFVISYPDALDSAVDPLGDSTDFVQIQTDALSRSRVWTPGTPLLAIPQAPVTSVGTLPGIDGTTTGWTSSDFDPMSFLSRPDIQTLPLSTQLAMLRTNESYAALMTNYDNIQTAIQTATSQGQQALASLQNNGFSVESSGKLTVKTNAPNATLTLDHTLYDNTNFVTSPTLFTVQVAGLYMISGIVNWDKGAAGVRNVFLIQNGTVVIDEESTNEDSVGPISQTFSVMQEFNAGDTLQIQTSQTTGESQDILAGAQLSVILVPSSTAVQQPAFTDVQGYGADYSPRQITADTTMVAGTAVEIQSDGGVIPIDPVGASATPFVDGVVTSAVSQSELANVGTRYGILYAIDGASFTPGGLVYVGPGGVLSQDYVALIQEVQWVIVVGKAISTDTIVYEPQIPTRIR